MATPASQLGIVSHPSRKWAAAAQPRKGRKKLTSPTAPASFHLSLNTCGSSSAPARKVRTIAPRPERNLIQDSSVPSIADPTAAPIISCAIVPTTISDNAEETRSQIESRVATNARPSQRAARAQMPVIARSLGSTSSTGPVARRASAPERSLNRSAENGGLLLSEFEADLNTADDSTSLPTRLLAWQESSALAAVLGDPIPLMTEGNRTGLWGQSRTDINRSHT